VTFAQRYNVNKKYNKKYNIQLKPIFEPNNKLIAINNSSL